MNNIQEKPDLTEVERIIAKYNGKDSWLVMILQDIQEAYNYLPEPTLELVAEKLNIPLSRVHSVATFYSSLSLQERGRHVIRVCDGTACHLKGFVNLRDEIERQTGLTEGQTTPDKRFSFEVVACLGACAIAPVMSVGNDYHGEMSAEKIKDVLSKYK
ncbi:MAG: NADH-quinone oxidoreductase subunit NuoE [Anaerohalosphaera sp.]|nr:NADH-quinone oxidoreductase subunit NuoE [Anaerohalosphaera sp.]